MQSIRKQLRLQAFTGIVAVVIVTALAMAIEAKVADDTTRLIDTKDLAADILPPPLYLVELRLVLGMAADGSLPAEQAKAEVARLSKEYQDRRSHWQQRGTDAPATVQSLLNAKAGDRFVEAASQSLTRLTETTADGKAEALKAVHALYMEHRREVDAQVTEAMAEATAATESIQRTERHGLIVQAALFVAAVLGLVLMGRLIQQAIWRTTGGEPAQAAAVANAVASGDLSVEVPTMPGDTSSVLAAMAHMRTQLASTVGAVRTCSDGIACGAAQIAGGNLDLSRRTERQAGSLQQTASAMEQFSGTVKQTADAAQQATLLAGDAGEVARRGAQAVGQVVGTMQEITASARKISEITSVIDSIAFQTNILALNAAVEAARAGEQGRGFAVVASEVRNLAQRSAAAAKEINTLISSSVIRIEAGGREAAQAGVTMDEIVGQVERVGTLINEISTATREQTCGIDLVSQAIGELDATTQQNTALVEESAAAAATLRDQAEALARAVGEFRTPA